MGDTVEPPARLVGREDRAVGNLLPDLIVKGFQKPGQALPGPGETAGTELKAGEDREHFYQVIHTDTYQVMKPGGENHQSEQSCFA